MQQILVVQLRIDEKGSSIMITVSLADTALCMAIVAYHIGKLEVFFFYAGRRRH